MMADARNALQPNERRAWLPLQMMGYITPSPTNSQHPIQGAGRGGGLFVYASDFRWEIGAGEGIRTLDPNLGKVVLYP